MPFDKHLGPVVVAVLVVSSLVAASTGCSMCSNCDLDAYSAYGGRWQRTDRTHGRVGSVFAPAGAMVPYGATSTVDPNSVLAQPPNDDGDDDDAAADQNGAEQSESNSDTANDSELEQTAFQDF